LTGYFGKSKEFLAMFSQLFLQIHVGIKSLTIIVRERTKLGRQLLWETVFFLFVFLASFPGSCYAQSQKANLTCKKVSAQECLGLIEKDLSIKISREGDYFSHFMVDAAMPLSAPLDAINALMGILNIKDYTISRDQEKTFSILVLGANSSPVVLDLDASNKSAPSKNDFNSPSGIPSSEELKTIEELSNRRLKVDLDKAISIPGQEKSSISLRQIQDIENKAENEIGRYDRIPAPNISEDLYVKASFLDKLKKDAEVFLSRSQEAMLPGGSSIDLKKFEKDPTAPKDAPLLRQPDPGAEKK